MNLVQLGEKLGSLPISVIGSGEITIVLKLFTTQINPILTDGRKLNASTTGTEIYKLFEDADADVQALMLEDIFDNVQTSKILEAIILGDKFQDEKDESAKKKWGSLGGSLLIICLGISLMVFWGFVSNHGLKPPIPEAWMGNMVTKLFETGFNMLIEYLSNQN